MARTGRRELAELLSAKEMIVVCGSGGTGKTTIAAALGAQAAAVVGGRVLVLTVDPARRLATALGIGSFGNTAVRVPPQAFVEAGLECRGELWVAMLDTKAGWDELIRRHAPDAQLRDTVLANPLYRNITGRFVNSHDYLAMEQLYDLHASGQYDLVVIDTPPSRNALDLLDAPGRMREFFGSRLLRWLTVPYRSRLFTFASKPFYQVADRVLGSRFLQDIAEFFVLFQTMEAGFVARAKEVERLLSDDGTAFVVVATPEAAPMREARYLVDALRERRLRVARLFLAAGTIDDVEDGLDVELAVIERDLALAIGRLQVGHDGVEFVGDGLLLLGRAGGRGWHHHPGFQDVHLALLLRRHGHAFELLGLVGETDGDQRAGRAGPDLEHQRRCADRAAGAGHD